jgi:hypothetical protein
MRLSFALPATLALFACTETADPASIRERIRRDVPAIVDETVAAGESADATVGALGQGLDALDRVVPGLLPDVAGAGEDLKRGLASADGEAPTGADVAEELAARVFADANHEGDGVFLVPVDFLCPAADGAVADPDCVESATRAQLRVRAELDGNGLAFTLLVGAERDAPVTLALHPNLLEVSVDLAAAAEAARAIGLLDPAIAVELGGVVSVRLDVVGAAHVAAAITIDRPIHVAVSDAADPASDFRLDSAIAHPLVRFELDGVLGRGSAQLGLGSTQLHLAGDAEAGSPATDLDLPGATANALLADGLFLASGIGLGDRATTISVGAQQAIAIDLNAGAGRRFDLAVTGDDVDATFAFTPSFDLRVAIDHAVLGDTPALYDVTRVALGGAETPALRSSLTVTGDSPETLSPVRQLEVVAGELVIETNPAGYGATIAAGQCIVDEARSDAAGDYTVLAPGACVE